MDYPSEAFWKHQEGKAVMTVHVTAKGIVDSCAIKTSSGSESLDRATCNVARHIKYEPALDQNGQPVEAFTSFHMNWVLPR